MSPLELLLPELNPAQRRMLLNRLLTLLCNDGAQQWDAMHGSLEFVQPINVIIERLERFCGAGDASD